MRIDLLCMVAVVAATMTIAGCAGPAVELQSKPAGLRIEAVATLATNECELQTAAEYSAVISARRTTTARLQAGMVSVAHAKRVQALADQARAALDRACATAKLDVEALAEARAARAQLTEVLNEAR